MSEIAQIIYAATALAAVFVTPIASYYTTKKRLRGDVVSQSRQKWITDLRQCLSDIVSHNQKSVVERKAAEGHENYYKYANTTNELITEINRAKLFLNPNEEVHKKLQDSLDELFDSITEFPNEDLEKIFACQEKVTQQGQILLKKAWDQVREDTA